ncbi:MAG: RNA polymerase subunit sigma [Planctomycetes bacterium]|nr:RNA polymerase subunit sigma [Planctomycetota bacterium]
MEETTEGRPADSNGPHGADSLLPIVYDELRKLAAARLAQEAPGQTLEPTALVHEVYLRLRNTNGLRLWDSRGHFFAAAAEAMRRILVESARHRGRVKRGGGRVRQELTAAEPTATELHEDVLELDEALTRLVVVDREAAELVQLRYFAGVTLHDAARLLSISPRTADRLWAYARAWLHRELKG